MLFVFNRFFKILSFFFECLHSWSLGMNVWYGPELVFGVYSNRRIGVMIYGFFEFVQETLNGSTFSPFRYWMWWYSGRVPGTEQQLKDGHDQINTSVYGTWKDRSSSSCWRVESKTISGILEGRKNSIAHQNQHRREMVCKDYYFVCVCTLTQENQASRFMNLWKHYGFHNFEFNSVIFDLPVLLGHSRSFN